MPGLTCIRSTSPSPERRAATPLGDEALGVLRPLRIPSDIRSALDLLQIAFCQGEFQNPEALRELKLMRRMIPLLTLSAWLGDDLEELFSGFVWEKGGHVVGNVNVHRSSGGKGTWLISNLAVHPSQRGKGVARRLMQAAKEHIVDRGGTSITLKARAGNLPASRLYERLGFQRLAREARLTKPPGVAPPASIDSPCQVRRANVEDSRTISTMRQRAAADEFEPAHLLRGTGPAPPVGGPTARWLRDALTLRRRQAWVAERRGTLLAYLEMTANRVPPFQRRMRLFPGSQCQISDAQALTTTALWSLGNPAKAEVKLTLQALGEEELEKGLHNLGFIEVSVEDTLWLNLRQQER